MHKITATKFRRKKKKKTRNNLCRLFLPFVWRHVDPICKVIAVRDHFDLLGTVVYHVSPRKKQKDLQTFQDFILKVVIVGGVETIHAQSNEIIHTVEKKKNQDL